MPYTSMELNRLAAGACFTFTVTAEYLEADGKENIPDYCKEMREVYAKDWDDDKMILAWVEDNFRPCSNRDALVIMVTAACASPHINKHLWAVLNSGQQESHKPSHWELSSVLLLPPRTVVEACLRALGLIREEEARI